MLEINDIINAAQIAIEDWEDRDAKNILIELRKTIADQRISETDPGLYAKLQKWIVYLQLVAFSSLSDEECEDILRNHYLESFAINLPMERGITAKLFLVPYLVRDEPRRMLKRGLSTNNQLLGSQTIGQWIQEFEKQFNVHKRSESAPVQFVMQNQKASILPQREKNILKEILHTYDYLLVSTLPELGDDLKNLLNSGSLGNNNKYESDIQAPSNAIMNFNTERQPQRSDAFSESSENKIQPVQISLLQALQQYPKLGEQNITVNPLKLRYFPNPVRPSIKNWMTDFHDNMGAGKHGTVDRGNYLFHSENGKRLTPMERQKLSVVLKSLDENSLLTVDPTEQKVIFPERTVQQPAIMSQESGIRKYVNNEEQKNIFQKNEQIKTVPRDFSSNVKKETFNYAPPIEDNYFQIPKSQPKVDLAPKMNATPRNNEPSIGSNNYSPNFKSGETPNFSSEQKMENVKEDNFKDFSNKADGKMSFTSPQRFPNEQQYQQRPPQQQRQQQVVQQQPQPQPQPQLQQQRQQQPQSLQQPPKIQANNQRFNSWVIKPSGNNDEFNQESNEAKAGKNIVDLRN